MEKEFEVSVIAFKWEEVNLERVKNSAVNVFGNVFQFKKKGEEEVGYTSEGFQLEEEKVILTFEQGESEMIIFCSGKVETNNEAITHEQLEKFFSSLRLLLAS